MLLFVFCLLHNSLVNRLTNKLKVFSYPYRLYKKGRKGFNLCELNLKRDNKTLFSLLLISQLDRRFHKGKLVILLYVSYVAIEIIKEGDALNIPFGGA